MSEAVSNVPGRSAGVVSSVKSNNAFRTISEVAEELNVAQHVLRFWESKFMQVRPLKRGGGRRYYRPEDVELLREIRALLYDQGYTIKGAQKLIRSRRSAKGKSTAEVRPVPAPEAAAPVDAGDQLQQLRDELLAIRARAAAAFEV